MSGENQQGGNRQNRLKGRKPKPESSVQSCTRKCHWKWHLANTAVAATSCFPQKIPTAHEKERQKNL